VTVYVFWLLPAFLVGFFFGAIFRKWIGKMLLGRMSKEQIAELNRRRALRR
jgi:hypothetical protein